MDSFTSAKSRSHCPSCSLDWSMRCISWSSRRRVDSISLLRIAISDAASSSARFDSSFFSSRERTMARRRPCSSLAMRSLHSISVRNFCISTSFLSFSISGAAFTSLSSLPTWMRRFILSSSTLTKAFFDSVFFDESLFELFTQAGQLLSHLVRLRRYLFQPDSRLLVPLPLLLRLLPRGLQQRPRLRQRLAKGVRVRAQLGVDGSHPSQVLAVRLHTGGAFKVLQLLL
mmetsp:Transcript_18557/g.46740  ORF Transcript_18557/g.46740 Transcript_18557/m.46740 type:complete len:229 (-) Transcript_18557:1633-2319(-)